MVVFPNVKINIGLQITEKRTDGYHNLVSCFYPVPWLDILEIIESNEFSFTSSGIEIPGDVENNLCTKAFQLLQTEFNLPPVAIYLHKQIPTGAGLGGGSSDASFTLKCLNQLFELNLEEKRLEEYAAQLGSDCPFFIKNKPTLATGRGEIFQDIALDLTGKYLVLIVPPVHLATKEAFSGIQPKMPETQLKLILEDSPIINWKSDAINDFESTVFSLYPQIGQIKEKLYQQNAVYSSMTGTGSCVYGIFEEFTDVKNSFPENYTIWQGYL